MKKTLIKCIDKFVMGSLKMNVNSTTSIIIFQPKIPKELSDLSKVK